MKKQLLVIHGGNVFNAYEEYVKYISDYDLTLEKILRKDWKNSLTEKLPDFQVIFPEMPSKRNAKYFEWKIWFKKILPLLEREIVLVGHSLGGIFLVKYLSENNSEKKIKGVFLVAPPYDLDEGHALADFSLQEDFSKLEVQAEKIIIYHSRDDPTVPVSNVEKYREVLPRAEIKIFEGRGHFNQEEFPEITRDIKSLFD